MRLKEACELFWSEYTNDSTKRKYIYILSEMMGQLGERRAVDSVTKVDIIRYCNEIRQRGLAKHTVYGYIKMVKAFWLYMVKSEVISRSPAEGIKNPRPKKKIDEKRVAKQSEFEMICNAAFGNDRNYAMIMFIGKTGCRAIGAATLELKNLDIAGRKAVVVEKFDKDYTVYFDDETAVALAKWLLKRPAKDHEFVFCETRKPYRPMKPYAVSQVIRRLSAKLGIRVLGSHSLRHMVGFSLADEGVNPNLTQIILNHSDVQTTLEFYYPSDDERAEKAIRELHSKHNQKILSLPNRGKKAVSE